MSNTLRQVAARSLGVAAQPCAGGSRWALGRSRSRRRGSRLRNTDRDDPFIPETSRGARSGIGFPGKTVLQYSIIFLGFSLDLGVVARVGAQSLAVMLFTLTAAFITACLVGKALKLDTNLKILVGVGTSICGGSAIAAAAPVIQASDEEVTLSISTIFLFNIVAVFLFPALGHLMGMSASAFGLWAGTAINDTSSVVAAAFSYGDAAGRFATVVKLTRTLMIIPVTLVLAFVARPRSQAAGKGASTW